MPVTDLGDFIARYAKPYDAATDTYRRPPYAASIRAGKNTPIYNAHSYHTKVPPLGIVPYIEHYTEPGDLVLDPFCGSGMTGVACLMTGRHAILNDLSPAAVHIAYNYCTPVDVAALKREFERIQAAVQDEFAWLYGTTCDRCDGPATIQYTIWSDVFACGRCGGEIVLWDVAVDHETGRVNEVFTCPKCSKDHTKLGLRKLPPVPVLTNYVCHTCRPSRAEHPTSDSEKARIAQIEKADIPYWVPSTRFDPLGPQYRRNALANRKIECVTDLYTKRNLRAFARLWQEAVSTPDSRIASALKFALTAINNYVNRKQNYGGGGGGLSGSIYIPSLVMEKHVGLVFTRKVATVTEYYCSVPNSGCAATVGSATNLSHVQDSSVDYVFTDPPFGSNLYYSELNLLYEAWLGNLTDSTLEAVVHRKQDGGTKRIGDYARLMTDSFREMHRVLKPGRWASVVFHNSDDFIWQTILDAAEAAGFELAEINSFDKEQLSFKGIRGAKGLEKVTNKDIVLNLHKPAPRSAPATNANGKAQRGNGDTEIRIVERIGAYLATDPAAEGRTLQALWNHALGEMIHKGLVEVSMEQVGRMLPYYFKVVDGAWYLRGQAVIGGRLFDLTTDSGALVWLNTMLAEPKTVGDLIPEWQKATAQTGTADPGRLERLLEQNYVQDKRTGRWRAPTEAERAAMSAQADISAQAHLRVVRRFLDGELPHKPTAQELAAWVQFCYSREAYREAAALFALLDASQLEGEHYHQLKRIAAVCQSKVQSAPRAT